ncbi:glycosyltransferase family 2 protein [Pseudosulfitobacter sp. DSM 107133]|uniref:glycosyltransferase family 2 protein n=1 Tax=Pseudosulfitobacter sp. DSM 107133 TaxID=2883100 RepID=UPI000DF36512|nr:glycosyltransferase family 2 protein [Pseudosulfitobacter sp. DSM 107133]
MKICAITMVYRDYWALAQWYRHYGALLGAEHLVVVAHGPDPKIAQICPKASILTVPRDDLSGFDGVRGRMLNGIQAGLAEVYDWVIRTDADELICLDPAQHAGLETVFAGLSGQALFALGLELVQTDDGTFGVFSGHYSKAWAVRGGVAMKRHGVQVRPRRVAQFDYVLPDGVFLAHLKFANRAALSEANVHRAAVATGPGKGLPGKAWEDPAHEARKVQTQVTRMEAVDWQQGVRMARTELAAGPTVDARIGLVRSRSFKLDSKCALPDWFPDLG